ncbi:DUF805 domain-containing protein [Tianweitania sediminis]|uniref:DUF805 domain-containing protein n=1 Tax=Tianweitania sediminis TaxID=1502156 RepID=A0A8J7QXB7_9HYPH|nr:DUF805 domain-containing protein [Tianweitania sediminis]
MSARQLIWFFFGLSGRISPSAFLLGGIFLYLARAFVFYRLYEVMLVSPESPEAQSWSLIFLFVVLASYWSFFTLSAKRFHDFGKPTLWAVSALALDLLLLIVLPFFRSDPGPNRYGPDTNLPG